MPNLECTLTNVSFLEGVMVANRLNSTTIRAEGTRFRTERTQNSAERPLIRSERV
jgi:hypothetical protein